MKYLIWAISCIVISITANAKITMPSYFTDNMILQQNSDIKLHGTANKNTKITIDVDWENKPISTRSDATGKWQVSIPTTAAGGPYNIIVSDGKKLKLKNVLIGEVWLCSGQSNMEMPVAGWGKVLNYEQEVAQASYPMIRLLQIKKRTSISAKNDCNVNMGGWQECSPVTVSEFSSLAYFFARKLYQNMNIPIGVIDCTWGGSSAEAWVSRETLKTVFGFKEKVEDIEKNQDNLLAKFNEDNEAWQNLLIAKDNGFTQKWEGPKLNDENWKVMNVPCQWETDYLPGFDGIVWFRKTIFISPEMENRPLTLNLGMIDDNDITYFNGVEIARGSGYLNPRCYTVPSHLVKQGNTVITVRISDFNGEGGITGKAEELNYKSGTTTNSLAGSWKYAIGVSLKDMPAVQLSPESINSPNTLYNGMINSLIDFKIKGAIWYQGESNVGRAEEYSRIFPALIQDWRNKWKYDFPFYFVQLASFMEHRDVQPNSGWALLREAQARALNLSDVGMVTAIEKGEAKDIHPKDKQEIGRRLGQLALKNTYGKDVIGVGPEYDDYIIAGDKIMIKLKNQGTNLYIVDGTAAKGFIIAGADKVFYKAEAKLINGQIMVSSPSVKMPQAVRYAWADNPECNIYGDDGMPLTPFRTDNW